MGIRLKTARKMLIAAGQEQHVDEFELVARGRPEGAGKTCTRTAAITASRMLLAGPAAATSMKSRRG